MGYLDEKRIVTEFLCVEQRYVIKFFMEKGMKGVEIIDRLKKHHGRDALQRTQVYNWIKEVKSGRKDLSNIPPPGKAPDEGLDNCIGKALKEDLIFQRKRMKRL
jgi:hypothetical protein